MFPMIRPIASANVETTSKYTSALTPTLPTFFASCIWAMPETTVQKIMGAITILISLMKPSPSAFTPSWVANAGKSHPTAAPRTIAKRT